MVDDVERAALASGGRSRGCAVLPACRSAGMTERIPLSQKACSLANPPRRTSCSGKRTGSAGDPDGSTAARARASRAPSDNPGGADMMSSLALEIQRQAQGQATWQLDPAHTLIE